LKAVAVCLIALVCASPALAGRISRSPYVFARSQVGRAAPLIEQAMRRQFGKSARTSVTCRGYYPGRHGGVVGFHEIHCPFTVVLLDAAGKSGVAVYWIDAHEHVQSTIRWD
jgi:hypothetical protein